MEMVTYNPLNVSDLQQQINRLFSGWGDAESSGATAGWVPTVDIREYSDRFQLFADLPGVDPEAVEITLDSGVLTISGQRGSPAALEGEKFLQHRSERGHGRFYRRFILPDIVDADKVAANHRMGILEISIPKQAKAQPRRIKVAA